jgi:hypothetical protein
MSDSVQFPDLIDTEVLVGVKARVNALVHLMLDEVESQLVNGTPAVKAQLLNRTLPAIMKELREEQEDDELTTLREQMAVMQRSITEALLSQRELSDPDAAT